MSKSNNAFTFTDTPTQGSSSASVGFGGYFEAQQARHAATWDRIQEFNKQGETWEFPHGTRSNAGTWHQNNLDKSEGMGYTKIITGEAGGGVYGMTFLLYDASDSRKGAGYSLAHNIKAMRAFRKLKEAGEFIASGEYQFLRIVKTRGLKKLLKPDNTSAAYDKRYKAKQAQQQKEYEVRQDAEFIEFVTEEGGDLSTMGKKERRLLRAAFDLQERY